MVRHWDRLNREPLDALSLGMFQGLAERDYEQTGPVKSAPAHGRGIGARCFLGYHPRQSMIL